MALPPAPPRASDRSEATIATLHPQVQPLARALFHAARAHGLAIEIIAGTRTHAEQEALYARGRTVPGRRVTQARGGESTHNFGVAFDVGVFEDGRYVADLAPYAAVGALGVALGLEWGGTWRSFADASHFQLRPAWAAGLTSRDLLAGLRRRHAEGIDPLA